MDNEIDELLLALENESNASIMKLSFKKIIKHKKSILNDMSLSKSKETEILNKIKDYRYCSEMSDLQEGNYIRWISLNYPDNIRLTRGAHILDIEILKNAIYILCKGITNKIFRIKFDECVIFQKLNNQENVILHVLKYLDN